MHWPGRNVPMFDQTAFNPAVERPSSTIEDTLAALGELVRAGKTRSCMPTGSGAAHWHCCRA